MSRERFYVTTPIYYVNDRPHVGHAYSSVLADVFARYHRLLGIPTWFQTGTDEHGQKVQDSAAERGVTPQAHTDEMSQHFRDLMGRLDIAYDDFMRTTEARHTSVITEVLQDLYDRGVLYKDTYAGWYCSRCERYWTEREVEDRGGGRCPDFPERHEVAWVAEDNYFFRMSQYAERLREAIESGAFRVEPQKRANEVLGFLRQGLGDLCISRNRERLSWGVPLPFDEDFVCYVWVDALFNYKTAIGYRTDDERHATWWPADVHLIGKDILKEHAVYWPSFLMAVEEPLPRMVLSHGWLLDPKGGKLSKSKRLDDDESDAAPQPTIEGLLDHIGVDGTRWFLASAGKPGDDMPFSWDLVRERLNADLANGLGNTANRLLKMAAGACGGQFPGLTGGGAAEQRVRAAAEAAIAVVRDVPDSLDLPGVFATVRLGVDAISGYLNEEKPWKLVKDDATLPRAREVIGWSLAALRLLALAVQPVVPQAIDRLRASLGFDGPLDFATESAFDAFPVGAPLGAPPNLFPRIRAEDLPSA